MSVSQVISATSADPPERRRAAHPATKLLMWRLPLGVASVVVVSVFTYLATRVLPGNAAEAILGQQATPASLARLDKQLGLNQSTLGGLTHWAGDFLSGHFGTSLSNGRTVTGVVLPQLVNSAVLVIVVALASTVLGVVAGVFAAHRRDGKFDDVASVLSLIASALPEFVIGVLVVFVFSVGVLHWFPAVSILAPGQRIWNQPEQDCAACARPLVIVTTPYMFRMVRAAMIEALTSDYAEVAQLKGATPVRLLFHHALPNAIAPGNPGLRPQRPVPGRRHRPGRDRVPVSGDWLGIG